jgi:SAM-dependent methyltransferase
MTLQDVVRRRVPPEPWAEGEKIPWHEPDFSRRMLHEHLSQEHDAASRRAAIVDRQVDWIHVHLLRRTPARVLDLGCGPGLYTSRLARLGHECVGIDFSPASIAHAREHADTEGLRCTYHQQDIRTAEYGSGYDLVMSIFGELNVFTPADARAILGKGRAALVEDGSVLLEVSSFAAVQALGERPPHWYSADRGLFSDAPHVCLAESFWSADRGVATERFYIVDGASGDVTRYAASSQAYTEEQYRGLLTGLGYSEVEFHSNLAGIPARSAGI